jgi:DNA-binding NtrC family response regulator
LPGKGSCFSLLLPFSPPPAAALPVARPHALSVLVIDGDPAVCESTARALGRMGHRPITSAPVEALALLEKRASDVQLVILDRAAAKVSGKDLVAGVRSLAPGVPVLLLAGYGEPAAEGSVSGIEALPVLGKPFGQKELEQAIATVRGAGLAPVTPPAGPSRSARPG